MTREAIEYFKFNRKIFCDDHLKICPKDSIAYQATLKEKEFYDMAIKALEQEPVLDKIRAEIEKLRPNLRPEQMTDYDYAMVDVVNDIVAIIYKYKAESEADNG